MAFKDQFMWVLDVSLIEQHYMVMNLHSNLRTKKMGFSHPSAAGQGRKLLDQVKKALTKRNLASIWIPRFQYSV